MPKLLVMDIETSAALAWVWGIWEQNVIEVEQDPFMLCFGYQWLGEGKPQVVALPDFPGYQRNKNNDYNLIKILRELLDQADIVLGQNSDAFDIKWFNTRCIIHKIPPPSPFKTIDTLKISRKHFAWLSNKLEFVSKRLGHEGKMHTGGWLLWKQCIKGDLKAWKRMKSYNKRDVIETVKVYKDYLPWISQPTPLWDRTPCPICKSSNVQRRGTYVNLIGKWVKHSCMDCGKCFRGARVIAHA